MAQRRPNTPVDPAPLRAASVVMDPARLGSLHPYRLSFMRLLMRQIMQERWEIERVLFDLDDDGNGTVIYRVTTPHGEFSFVAFAHEIDPTAHSDRVIADRWDMTATFCEGRVDAAHLAMLRDNVPKQEAGRIDARSLVLSRANRSSRNFEYVVAALAAGEQPSLEQLVRVGYLYRTTAVYGSGKFGMADWAKVRSKHVDFARPFAAEMFTCYLIRHFSLDQAQHIARRRAPQSAVAIQPRVQRYFGIGNATGLGMAPFLINHPLLISRWVEVRETALARVIHTTAPDAGAWHTLGGLIAKAMQHLREIETGNAQQDERNQRTRAELAQAHTWVRGRAAGNWRELTTAAQRRWGLETQELLHTLLMEMYAEQVDGLAGDLAVDERYELAPEQPLGELKAQLEASYDWALAIDFSDPVSSAVFWYRSAEKMEPRLGQCGVDEGQDKQMQVAVARAVRECYDQICATLATEPDWRVAEFAMRYPGLRGTLRRVQTMAATTYGDIRANLVDAQVMPIDLMRCKLSFFGVSKFDPKSRLWVRNTMFQGAPIVADIGAEFHDDWYFPVLDTASARVAPPSE